MQYVSFTKYYAKYYGVADGEGGWEGKEKKNSYKLKLGRGWTKRDIYTSAKNLNFFLKGATDGCPVA